MNAFALGFIKEAMSHGCSEGEAFDLYKYAIAMGTSPKSPIIDTVAPSKLFPVPQQPPAPLPPSTPPSFGAFPANASSVTSAPGAAINKALDTPVTPTI